MQLWGKLVRGIFLVAAVAFAIAGVVVPMDPRTRLGFGLVAIISVAVAFGVPWLVRLFSSFTGDEDVLRSGVAATATIRGLEATRWSFGRYMPIIRFELEPTHPDHPAVLRVTQAVDPPVLARLAPGVVVGIRLDPRNPSRAVIDWHVPIAGTIQEAG